MEHEPLVRRVLSAFVIAVADAADPLPSNDEILEYVNTTIERNAIEVRAIDDRNDMPPSVYEIIPVHAFYINFYDDCDVSIVVFVDDDETPTHAMLSADMQPYVPMHI